MSKLKDSCCIICNTNITDSSTISIRDYMRPLSNSELSLYSFFQLISNFNQLDISEVPQNACNKCYQAALHVLDFQTLCNKAVENIKTYSEDIEHVCVGNDCDVDILYLPEEDTEDGYDVVEIITKNPDNAKDENIASSPTPLYLSEEDTVDGYDVVEIITKNADNAKDEDNASLPAPVPRTRIRKQSQSSNQAHLDKLAERVECEHCHKLYRKDYMHIHKRSHTGEKPFKCKLCPKDFKSASSLRLHMQFHNDKRPYMCDICGKTFRSKGIHDAHYTIHSDEKPFTCSECPMRFRLETYLKQHMLIHVKNEPIECIYCGNLFTQYLGLRRHQARSCPGSKNNAANLM